MIDGDNAEKGNNQSPQMETCRGWYKYQTKSRGVDQRNKHCPDPKSPHWYYGAIIQQKYAEIQKGKEKSFEHQKMKRQNQIQKTV